MNEKQELVASSEGQLFLSKEDKTKELTVKKLLLRLLTDINNFKDFTDDEKTDSAVLLYKIINHKEEMLSLSSVEQKVINKLLLKTNNLLFIGLFK
jgi:hypothetical protein